MWSKVEILPIQVLCVNQMAAWQKCKIISPPTLTQSASSFPQDPHDLCAH